MRELAWRALILALLQTTEVRKALAARKTTASSDADPLPHVQPLAAALGLPCAHVCVALDDLGDLLPQSLTRCWRVLGLQDVVAKLRSGQERVGRDDGVDGVGVLLRTVSAEAQPMS